MLDPIVDLIENSGAWVYLLAPLFMIVVAILPIPAEIPAMLNGMVFGSTVGALITWSGGLVGAIVSFELARRFGRPLGEKLLSRQALARTDRVALSAGWPGLLTLRLIPTVAFTAVNWAAGLTAIRRWTFWWTTAVGITPGAILFTMSGTGLAAFYRHNPEFAPALLVLALFAAGFAVYRYRRLASRTDAIGNSAIPATPQRRVP
ncbi:MAG: hypothetical protein GTN62_13370 [Gemmatimonadales bacterium]|nr:hypothetical protein [Gemmatimonadales bacterium]NIN13001.1 hypothetical protein [Gemmatimonadales bacterium]NIN51078.1 hypothetical protein [Gemmatimonadales bacterium]NIP08542.1 hypothetical protein [Gemmatimonadales bacterium]NIR02260.1 hypothetical protein [Gemmatimonadales bacterium]